MKALILSATFLFSISLAYPQEFITLSGSIKDADSGTPLPGVNISIKGTVLGTISDGDGRFQIKFKPFFPTTLSFSFIGFKTQELILTSKKDDIEIRKLNLEFIDRFDLFMRNERGCENNRQWFAVQGDQIRYWKIPHLHRHREGSLPRNLGRRHCVR